LTTMERDRLARALNLSKKQVSSTDYKWPGWIWANWTSRKNSLELIELV
jgi:hypothetical protein